MSTRAKFIYFVLALILAFTGLATAAFSATHTGDLAGWDDLESASFHDGTIGEPAQTLAGDCAGNAGSSCP